MACRFPHDCRKKPDPRNDLCRGCAISVARQQPSARAIRHERALHSDPAIVERRLRNQRARLCIQWTADMDAKLIEMATARIGATPIGNAVGVGKAAVRQRRDALGLPKGRAPGGSKSKRGTVRVKMVSV